MGPGVKVSSTADQENRSGSTAAAGTSREPSSISMTSARVKMQETVDT